MSACVSSVGSNSPLATTRFHSEVNKLHNDSAIWISMVGMGSNKCFAIKRSPSAIVVSNSSRIRPDTASGIFPTSSTRACHFWSQVWTHGSHCTVSRDKYTTPMRLTVAGDACSRSLHSNNIFICGRNFTRSPLARHSVMLSSSTVLRLSIHSVSTGPSNITHCRLSSSMFALSRMMVEARPSAHSAVSSLNSPYSSPMEMDFGFKMW